MYIRNIIVAFLVSASLFQCTDDPATEEKEEKVQLDFALDNGGINLPDGFKAVVVADSVGPARHIAVRNNGDIYVALRSLTNEGGIVALRDTNQDGVADRKEYFGEEAGTGIQIYNGNLYFSSNTEIYRLPFDNNLVPQSKWETVVQGFPEQRSHSSKSFTIDVNGNLYVNVGAPSNSCQEEARTKGSPGMDPCPQLEWQAGIWSFDATEVNQTQQGNGYHYATGIRNAMAIDWNKNAEALYVVQHGRDQLNTLWPEYYSDEDNALTPSEDFLLVRDGSNFGWPYSYFDGRKNQRMVAPEYGGDGEQSVEKGKYESPIMTFPGHWAPNDLIFYQGKQFPERYRKGAFIAFHGSWNRAPEPQSGYNVVFVPMSGAMPAGDYEIFADGFPGAESFVSPGDAVSRPMGLAVGPDGSLYITDSVKGKIWRVVYENPGQVGKNDAENL